MKENGLMLWFISSIIFVLKIWHPISISGQHEETWTRSALLPKTKINKALERIYETMVFKTLDVGNE